MSSQENNNLTLTDMLAEVRCRDKPPLEFKITYYWEGCDYDCLAQNRDIGNFIYTRWQHKSQAEGYKAFAQEIQEIVDNDLDFLSDLLDYAYSYGNNEEEGTSLTLTVWEGYSGFVLGVETEIEELSVEEVVKTLTEDHREPMDGELVGDPDLAAKSNEWNKKYLGLLDSFKLAQDGKTFYIMHKFHPYVEEQA